MSDQPVQESETRGENPPVEPQSDTIPALESDVQPYDTQASSQTFESAPPGEVAPEPSMPESSPPPPAPPVEPMPQKSRARKRRRGSIFFPLLLIVLGGVLLFNNLGIIPGTTWNTLLSLWPVLFIAWGLDSIWRNEGVTGPVFLLGIGVVFLLGNFGYLQISPWQILLTLWPVLFVAIGIDILLSRWRSWWATLLGLVIVFTLMVGALWLAGVGLPMSGVSSGESVEYNLQGATRAEVSILPGAGTLDLKGITVPDILIKGTIPSATGNRQIVQEYVKVGDTAKLSLKMTGSQISYPSGGSNQALWNLGLTSAVPVDLEADLGAGDGSLDLTGMQISDLGYNMGVGFVTITLPETGNFTAKIDGGVGQITILVPAGVAVQLNADTGLVVRTIPADFVKLNGNTYNSAGFTSAENKVVLDVNLAIGQVTVQPK